MTENKKIIYRRIVFKKSLRISLVLSAVVAFTGQLFAVTPQQAVDQFVKSSGIPSGSIGIKVINLADGEITAQHNSDMSLVPASIMKSVTTASLFEEAGADWKYHTKVYTDGFSDMGILRGNIIIEGACDPSLHSAYEPFGNDIAEEIVKALTDLRITAIEGDIIIDESAFAGASRPASWQKGDHKKYYGTGSHAFNFENNTVGDYAVENPSARFIEFLKNRLGESKIEVSGKNLGEGKRVILVDHISPPLDEIMRSCMMRSDNLFAECMLRTYGKLNGADGSTYTAAKLEKEKWESKKYPMTGVNIVDGSGLSRENRVTADFMATLLQDMAADPTYASFFPLAGQEGTLKKFLTGSALDSYIAMKTGSMKGIQCYAGYKLDDNYEPVCAIVVIMNDITGDRNKLKKTTEKMFLDMFEE